MSLGCSAITRPCAPTFSPELSGNRQCFPFLLPLTFAEDAGGLSVEAFTVVEHDGPNISAMWMVRSIMDVSKSSTLSLQEEFEERERTACWISSKEVNN